MIASEWRPVPAVISLSVIAGILLVTVVASLMFPARNGAGPTAAA
jgi:hypothetical protein